MIAGMVGIIAAHSGYTLKMPHDYKAPFILACNGCGDERPVINEVGNVRTPPQRHNMHVADELEKAGYGNVQEAKAEALTDAANWLVNGEAAGIIAYDGPSNRGEVMAAYDAALEDPEGWLRERAEAALAIDPADLYREEQGGMAEAWREGHAASSDMLNPYEDWPSTPDPLAVALADPEGHALVKAIHDRKAGA